MNVEIEKYEENAKSLFVMGWGKLLTTYTAMLSIVEAFLVGFQAWAQGHTGELAAIGTTWWYQVLTVVVALLIPVVRNLRQKSVTTVVTP